ncbi:MAG: DUF167 domain-containing protein, partial [Candidatus Peregrinibacteria bacterium]|nr:DUF167 domain-containing protein [Candidatus Peregrinibacteria bacterium]
MEEFFERVREGLEKDGEFCFRAKITAGRRKSEFVEVLTDKERTVKIRIAAVPEKGKANKEIVK